MVAREKQSGLNVRNEETFLGNDPRAKHTRTNETAHTHTHERRKTGAEKKKHRRLFNLGFIFSFRIVDPVESTTIYENDG